MKSKLRMKLEIKDITEQGSFEGMLSPYGNVDSGRDLVEPGAYAKTLKDAGNTRPLLWQHKPEEPIGDLTLEDRPDGLWAKGQLLMALPEAQKAYLLIKNRIVKGLSIGYESIKDSVEAGVRHLKEIKLYEGSIVTFPMNEMALITNVKRRGEIKDDFNEELADIQVMDSLYQMRCALYSALDSMIWSGAGSDQIVSASETIIQQFSDAYLAVLPDYLAVLAEMYGGMETMAARKKFEEKAGREISAANMDKLTQAREHMKAVEDHTKAAHDIVSALCEDKAGKSATTPTGAGASATSKSKAAGTEHSEPDPFHSLRDPFSKSVKDILGLQ